MIAAHAVGVSGPLLSARHSFREVQSDHGDRRPPSVFLSRCRVTSWRTAYMQNRNSSTPSSRHGASARAKRRVSIMDLKRPRVRHRARWISCLAAKIRHAGLIAPGKSNPRPFQQLARRPGRELRRYCRRWNFLEFGPVF